MQVIVVSDSRIHLVQVDLLGRGIEVEGFNTLVSAGGFNLPDKRVDPDCWLRSGFESPQKQLGFKPLSGSHQLWTLHCRATLICASFGGC